jgi:hypothetical protein
LLAGRQNRVAERAMRVVGGNGVFDRHGPRPISLARNLAAL